MKKLVISVLLSISLLLSFASCDMIPQEKDDVITVEDGYLVVNGVKTEHKVDDGECEHEPTLIIVTVVDGYIAINGVKTEYKVDDGDCDCEPTPDVIYEISEDGTYAKVIGYTGTATGVKIAEKYNGLPVRMIRDYAFRSNTTITSVVIPDSVTNIGNGAFSDCSSLTSVVIGDSVTSIGDSAFFLCNSLTSVVIGDSVTSIGSIAFAWCDHLTSLVIPNHVRYMGEYAFTGCSSLTDMYYTGSEAEWQEIDIKYGIFDHTTNPTIHYNYVP